VVSPEIETDQGYMLTLQPLRGKGAVVSPEIETSSHLADNIRAYGVARERWSRLRLKRKNPYGTIQRGQGGKGAVVSPEIETMVLGLLGQKTAWWQGSGGLA